MEKEIEFKQENLHIVPINEVRANDWNPKKHKGKGYREVVRSIENRGLVAPIMVRTNPKGDTKYEVVDGCNRFAACLELGFDRILIYDFGEIDDATAKSYTIYMEMGVKPDRKMFNDLLIELKDQIDLPYSIDYIESIELEDPIGAETPEVKETDDDKVPNYCFTGLSQEEFDFIANSMDEIAQEIDMLMEKDILIYLINYWKNTKNKQKD